jgi:hypothetical protein
MDGHVRKLDTSPARDRGLSAAGAEDLRDTIRASRRVSDESRINLGEGSIKNFSVNCSGRLLALEHLFQPLERPFRRLWDGSLSSPAPRTSP